MENSTWWSRNWKWFLPTLCLLLMTLALSFFGLLFYGVSSMMKSSDVYQAAVHEAKNNAKVKAAIGEPIEEGFFTSGNISVNDASGSADLSIPISGPKGNARVYLSATKSVGKWTFRNLEVEIGNTDERIDLLESDTTTEQ